MIRKLKTKKGMFLLIVCCLTMVIGTSYGYFVFTTSGYKASELLISELQYGINIVEDGSSISTINNNSVIVPAGKKAYFYVTLSSINKIDSKYTLAYKKTNEAVVQYTDRTPWSSQGVIKGYDDSTYAKRSSAPASTAATPSPSTPPSPSATGCSKPSWTAPRSWPSPWAPGGSSTSST